MRAALCAVAFVLTSASVAWADAGFHVPAPPDDYVGDDAHLLSPSTREELAARLGAYESATGHQLLVYVAPGTNGVPLETFTAVTASAWKAGRKGYDDGAVLFIFPKDRRVRIEVGYGLESTLTDADADRIIRDDVIPKLEGNDLDGAADAGVDAMIAAIAPAPQQASASGQRDGSGGVPDIAWLVLIVFALIVGLTVLMQSIAWGSYGVLCAREGRDAASRDMRRSWLNFFWSNNLLLLELQVAFSILSSGRGSERSGFSGGGGGFGGGGASGSY